MMQRGRVWGRVLSQRLFVKGGEKPCTYIYIYIYTEYPCVND